MTPMTDLMAAMPHVLAAPKDETTAAQLMFRPGRNQREEREELILTRAEGIPGDRWLSEPWLRLYDGAPDPGIQVSLLPKRVHDLVRPDPAASTHPGDPIIADIDTSLANMPEGTILQAGSAKLRVTAIFNDGCAKWKVRYGRDAYDWLNLPAHIPLRLRGILCAVEEDGIIRKGDPIRVLSR